MNKHANQPQLRDLISARNAQRRGESTALAEMDTCIAKAEQPSCANAFLKTSFETARREATTDGIGKLPLAGLAISVKDLFDVAGQVTAAGSTALLDSPPALRDCPAVARLKAAGGIVIGRTNMVEFAFSGIGTNPHFGTPANPAATDVPRIPGGSSSGAAVSVAAGAAFIGIGSDTGGSIRIPAALNGIVGFKSTARLVPTQGALPLSTTMDTVCALTRSVRDAILAHEVMAARVVTRSSAPLSAYRLAIAKPLMQDAMDATVCAAWHRTLSALRVAGAKIEEIALEELDELPGIQATGGFSAAESYAWHFELLQKKASMYDPRVLARIQRGANMSAKDYIELTGARSRWIARMESALARYDAVLSPTVPIVAPPIAEIAPGNERDDAFFRVNGLLLRNTSVINMLDGCAISIPCHAQGEFPVGLMVWAPALHDDPVLNIAVQIERTLQQQ